MYLSRGLQKSLWPKSLKLSRQNNITKNSPISRKSLQLHINSNYCSHISFYTLFSPCGIFKVWFNCWERNIREVTSQYQGTNSYTQHYEHNRKPQSEASCNNIKAYFSQDYFEECVVSVTSVVLTVTTTLSSWSQGSNSVTLSLRISHKPARPFLLFLPCNTLMKSMAYISHNFSWDFSLH